MTGQAATTTTTGPRRAPVTGWFFTVLCCLPADRSQPLSAEEVLIALRAAGCRGASTRQVLSSLAVLKDSPFVTKVVDVPHPKYALTARGMEIWTLLREHCPRWTEKTFRTSRTDSDGNSWGATFSRDVVRAALIESTEARSVESLSEQTMLSRDSVRRGLKLLETNLKSESGVNSEGNNCRVFFFPTVREIAPSTAPAATPTSVETEDGKEVVVDPAANLVYGEGDADDNLDFDIFKDGGDQSIPTVPATPSVAPQIQTQTPVPPPKAASDPPVDIYVEEENSETLSPPVAQVQAAASATVTTPLPDSGAKAETPSRTRAVVLPPIVITEVLWNKIVVQASVSKTDPAMYLCDFLSEHLNKELANIVNRRHKRLLEALKEV